MSIPRLTQILENALADDRITVDIGKSIELDVVQAGWISEKITESGGGSTHTVKDGPGKVAMLLVEGAQNVTLQDDTEALWAAVNNASVDWSRCPLTADTSIKLTFAGDTSAWIVYK